MNSNTSKINMSQVRTWGITHFDGTGYLGPEVDALVNKDGVIWNSANVITPYKHKAWMNDAYTRQFQNDSCEALRAWLAILTLARNRDAFVTTTNVTGMISSQLTHSLE